MMTAQDMEDMLDAVFRKVFRSLTEEEEKK